MTPRPGMGLGRPAVVLSIVVHVVGFFVIVGVPRLLASGPDMRKVYVVDLVTLPGPAGPGPAAPRPPAAGAAAPKTAAAPKPPPAKKPVEKAIVLPDRGAQKPPAKAQPEKPAPAKPREEPPAAEAGAAADAATAAAEAAAPEPATTTPTTTAPAPTPAGAAIPAGTPAVAGGGEGDGTGGGGDAYTFYLALLKRNIENAWKRPVYTGDATLTATVNLRLSRAGRVQKLELSRRSGFEPLDRSLMVAVRAAEPFPPFPVALAMDSLGVQIVFDLTPEGSEPENPGD